MSEEIINKLNKLCDETYTRTERPMGFPVDGEPWTFATDGALLVGIKGDMGFPEPSFKKFEVAIKKPEITFTVSFPALVRFVDCPPEWDDDDCELCGGSIAPRRPAYINEYIFSRELLARIIDTVPSKPESVEAGVGMSYTGAPYLYLRADDWMACLMAMRDGDYTGGWEMPKFNLEAPNA